MGSRLWVRRPLAFGARLTLVALTVNALAYASEFRLIGGLDREVSIVVACLVASTILVATGWPWAPAVGALVAGGIMFGNPFLLYNLSQPPTSGFFLAAVTEAVSGPVAVTAGIAATVQSFRKHAGET